MRARVGLLAAALLVAAGCASTGSDKARVLRPGQRTIAAGLEASVAAAQLTPGRPAPLPGIQLATEYRHGLRFGDLGVRAWGLGIRGLFGGGFAADGKIALREPPGGGAGWAIALRGGGGYHQLNLGGYPMHFPFVDLAGLFGYDFRSGNQIFVAIRMQEQWVMGQDVHTVDLPFGGLSLGYAWRVGRIIELRPQLSVMGTPVSFNGTQNDPERKGLTITQLALGVVWDL